MTGKKQQPVKGFNVKGMILALKGFGLSHGLVMRTMEKLGLPISYNLITETMTNWKNDQLVGNLDLKKYLDLMELRRTDPDAYYKKLNTYKRDKLETRNSKWKNKVFSLQNVLSTSKLSSSSNNQNSQLLSKKQKSMQSISPHKLRHENHQQKQFNSNIVSISQKKMSFERDSDFEDLQSESGEDDFRVFDQKYIKKSDFGKLDKNHSKIMHGSSTKIIPKLKIISKRPNKFQ
ncbi:hypothetical protein TTHERM_00675900 (macronuclear) [Tetrahymena thermophila SB210]|uniref:Uncharacterized protein n=1 Tax=Tetrahymena thermophila (strain SB210) TaxID=312017 RepID=Q23DX0_TETTS|nr:hypothetical protein TTHERM_00675900 [Tetrahymena thermophila SB210]EAR94817.2 hypothetical protein TTHERM_00675900 [Tetrahymena thermophila SB210]|eukprot:XP_001015062.2 hypothetical protein TTHERM_00675900 [Tetrahymena thermophila SB210]